MLRNLKHGSLHRLKDKSGLPGIILGARLAQSTGMMLNSIIEVIVPTAK